MDTYFLELEKRTYHNIREKLGLILDLITNSSQVLRGIHYPPRTKYEINGGYKIATRRGARLVEVDVFNLYFRFRSHLAGDGIALMYRPKNMKTERIILLPDDTEQRIGIEKRLYLNEARELSFGLMMDSDD